MNISFGKMPGLLYPDLKQTSTTRRATRNGGHPTHEGANVNGQGTTINRVRPQQPARGNTPPGPPTAGRPGNEGIGPDGRIITQPGPQQQRR